MKSLVTYPRDPNPSRSHLPFSQAVRVGELIFVSGHASVEPAGQIVSDSFEGEIRRLVENLRKVLQAAGSDLALFNQLYREYFSAPFPAWTTITHCLPATLRFEIEYIAVARE